MHSSQTARDKFRGQKGNSPDLQLRSQIYAKCVKAVMQKRFLNGMD